MPYILILIIYTTLIIFLIIGFDRIGLFLLEDNVVTQQKFTVIIPFRNEEENITQLAKSLMEVNYLKSHFEVFWVNDGSTDNSVPLLTEFIIKNHNWKLLDNQRKSNSPKKDAIQIAIQQSNYDYIITTDADCIIPKKWLQIFNNFIDKNKEVKMIAAPVAYQTNNSFLHQFQSIDFLSLIGTTIGSFGINNPFMCNGANLCYSKQAFYSVNGFEGNNNIASGDDVFLLEKINNKYSGQVKYLKSVDALVLTKPENNLKLLINQRIRWASKTSATNNLFSKLVGVVVLLMNLLIVFGYFIIRDWQIDFNRNFIFIAFMLKIIIDYILIKKTFQFVNQKLSLKYYLLSSLIYPFFVIFVVFKSFFTKVKWKN